MKHFAAVFLLTGLFYSGYVVGVGSGRLSQSREDDAAAHHRESEKRRDLAASCSGGTCPSYEQLRDQHYCNQCISECYPLVNSRRALAVLYADANGCPTDDQLACGLASCPVPVQPDAGRP